MGKDSKQVIGVDLGGTKIEIALVNASSIILQHKRLVTDVKGGAPAIEKQIVETIHEMAALAHGPIHGVGVGVAGQVDDKTGKVLFAPNLYWKDHPLQQNLHQALQIPVKVVNDLRAITWGEWLYGAGQGCDDLVCIFVGTGIGGGVVSGGRMLSGCTNTCGEIGHMTIDFHGPLCTCGNRGCFEAFAGGWAITKLAQEAIKNYDSADCQMLLELAHHDISKVDAKVVVEAYHKGDALALLLMEKVKQALVAGCVGIVNAFNPCRLILGGGVLSALPEFIPLIDSSVRLLALKAATKNLEVHSPKLAKEEGGVLGCAAVAFNELNKGSHV